MDFMQSAAIDVVCQQISTHPRKQISTDPRKQISTDPSRKHISTDPRKRTPESRPEDVFTSELSQLTNRSSQRGRLVAAWQSGKHNGHRQRGSCMHLKL